MWVEYMIKTQPDTFESFTLHNLFTHITQIVTFYSVVSRDSKLKIDTNYFTAIIVVDLIVTLYHNNN